MTGKRRVGRQDLKAVRLLAVLLVTLALMLQMDGQMDAAYAGQQMPGSSPVLEEEMLYITRKLDAGPELAGAGGYRSRDSCWPGSRNPDWPGGSVRVLLGQERPRICAGPL